MMRVALLCFLIAGCATPAHVPAPVVRCAPLPTLVAQPTPTQLAAYAQQVVELYGQCATLHSEQVNGANP
jgi:hypothetical protein